MKKSNLVTILLAVCILISQCFGNNGDYVLKPGQPTPCIDDSSYLAKPFYIGQVKVVNAYLAKQCSLHIFHDPLKVSFHRIKFTNDGGFEHFVSSATGTSSRHYYLLPNQLGKFQIQLSQDGSDLYVDTRSASRAQISVKDGSIQNMEAVQINPDTDYLRDPVGNNRPVLGVRRGYLVDSGVRYGVDARIPVQKKDGKYQLKYSKVMNTQSQVCYVPNFYLYNIVYDRQGYADSFQFLFRGDQKATVPYKQYLEHSENLPEPRKKIFLEQINLIDLDQAPDHENFEEYISRVCENFELMN